MNLSPTFTGTLTRSQKARITRFPQFPQFTHVHGQMAVRHSQTQCDGCTQASACGSDTRSHWWSPRCRELRPCPSWSQLHTWCAGQKAPTAFGAHAHVWSCQGGVHQLRLFGCVWQGSSVARPPAAKQIKAVNDVMVSLQPYRHPGLPSRRLSILHHRCHLGQHVRPQSWRSSHKIR